MKDTTNIIGGICVRHYLFGLICVSSYTLNQVNMKWLKIERETKDHNFYFQYTMPFALITGVTLHTVMFVLRKRRANE